MKQDPKHFREPGAKQACGGCLLGRAAAKPCVSQMRRTLFALIVLSLSCGCLTATNSPAAPAAATPELGILVAVAQPIDFLARTYGHYLDWVAAISDGTFWTTVRLAFTLIVCTTFCGLTFHHLRELVSRSTLLALQWVASLSALVLFFQPILWANCGRALSESSPQRPQSPAVAGFNVQSGKTGFATELTAKRKQLLLNNRPQKRVFFGLFDGLFASCFSPLLLVSGDSGDDSLSHLFRQYCDWANSLHPHVFQFFVRSTLALGLSSLFCWLAFRRGNRSVLLQAFIFLNSIFLAMVIPVAHWQPSHRVVKAWVVAICMFLTATLPVVLPLFVAPELGSQRRIRQVTFAILLVLFIGTLIRALSSWKS